MKVRLSLRVPNTSPKTRHDWEAFTTNPDLQARYTARHNNRAVNDSPHKSNQGMCSRSGEVKNIPEIQAPRDSDNKGGSGEDTGVPRQRNDREQPKCIEQSKATALQHLLYDRIKEEEIARKIQRVEAAQGE